MSQKVSPILYRIGYIKTSKSRSYLGKDYSEKLKLILKIRQLFENLFKILKIAYEPLLISMTPYKLIINTRYYNPLRNVIPYKSIMDLLSKLTSGKFKIIKLILKRIKRIELSASIYSQRLSFFLLKNSKFSFRKLKYLASLKGYRIKVSGRQNKQRAKSYIYQYGSVPRQTISAPIDYSLSTSKTSTGIMGIKVWLYFKKNTDYLLHNNNNKYKKLRVLKPYSASLKLKRYNNKLSSKNTLMSYFLY